jgi:type IV pilus assembly protein PilW
MFIYGFLAGLIVGLLIGCLLFSSKARDLYETNLHLESRLKNKDGFTLTELMVAMGISVILIVALCQLFVSQDQAYSSNANDVRTMQESRATMNKLVREIRMAGYKTDAGVKTGLQSATDKTIAFTTDVNLDNTVENITIAYDPSTKVLNRNGGPYLQNVNAFDLSYTLVDGSVTTAPTDLSLVRKIRIQMTVQSEKIDMLTRNYKTFSIYLDVTPRNLGI